MSRVHVRLERVTKRFGAFVAVNRVQLAVPAGSFVTLLGPSGCGKTTTLRLIAGFYDTDEGTIHIGDRVVNDIPPEQRNTAMVFQDFALFPHMTVFENIAYGLRMRRLPNPEVGRRVEEVARLLHLEGTQGQWPHQLSGGQQQRVALARALVVEPEVLLLDEPLSNLDAKLRVRVRGEIRQVQQQLGKTTVYVTHDQVEALSLSDIVVVMNRGRVEQVGAPLELYRRPASHFVADFIGEANLLPAVVREGMVRVAGYGFPLTQSSVPQGAVTLMARPESVHIRLDGDGLAGRIRSAFFVGPFVNYVVETEAGEVSVIGSLGTDAVLRVGAAVTLEFDLSKIYLLPSPP